MITNANIYELGMIDAYQKAPISKRKNKALNASIEAVSKGKNLESIER